MHIFQYEKITKSPVVFTSTPFTVNYLYYKRILPLMSKHYATSPGEEAIEGFLNDKGISFKREVKIPKLKEDYADYRVADFYLPRYKVFIEFLGEWNSEKGREKYKKKKEIYKNNNVPCVYIYPDNFGVLEIIFRRRLRDVLKNHPKLKFQRFIFNFDILVQKHSIEIIVLVVLLIYFIKDTAGRILFSLILIYSLYNAIKETFFK